MVSAKESLERIAMATFGLAWAGCSIGTPDALLGRPDAWLPAAVGIAGLIGVVVSDFAKAGPELQRKLDRIRLKVKAEIEAQVGDLKTQYDIKDVDGALGEELRNCFLDRKALVKAASDPSGFPAKATELVMAALAERRPELFGDTAPKAGRDYAKTVISTALWAAVEDRAYFEAIQAQLTLAQSQEIARILESNGRIEAAVSCVADVADQTRQSLELARAEAEGALRAGGGTSVAFRSAKECCVRGAKGDYPTVIDSPALGRFTFAQKEKDDAETDWPCSVH